MKEYGVDQNTNINNSLLSGRLRSTTAQRLSRTIPGQPPPTTAARQEMLEDSWPLHLPEFNYAREHEAQGAPCARRSLRCNPAPEAIPLTK